MQSTAITIPDSAHCAIRAQQTTLDDLPDGQLVTPPHAAALLHTAEGTLAVWRTTGRYNLPYVKLGHRVLYRVGDLRAFVERRTRQHTGDIAA